MDGMHGTPLTQDEVPALARLGSALWGMPARAQILTAETMSAVALKEDATLESVARALLARAEREPDSNSSRLDLPPFYQLSVTERFLLIMLHYSARWSYARVQRILGWEGDAGRARLEMTLWGARLRLAELTQGTGALKTYPVGASARSGRCPDHDPRRPWAQRFMDDEIGTGAERNFLQNHLMACDGCRRSLHAAKEIYYGVDRAVPRFTDDGLEVTLQHVLKESRILREPTGLSSYQSLKRYFLRDDVKFAAVAFALFMLWGFLR